MKLQPTSGTRKKYKPGQLVTINHHVFRIAKGRCRNDNCIHCFDYDCNRFDFCIYKLPTDLHLEPIKNIRVELHQP